MNWIYGSEAFVPEYNAIELDLDLDIDFDLEPDIDLDLKRRLEHISLTSI
jgi:hypothetical protein